LITGFASGSEIASMSVMDYDVPEVFEGRGSLEAAAIGVYQLRKMRWPCAAILSVSKTEVIS
jgi:2,3-bisphosphoglycerate-independent phosphoglycerate mutase